MFGIHRTGPCYKWTVLYKDTFIVKLQEHDHLGAKAWLCYNKKRYKRDWSVLQEVANIEDSEIICIVLQWVGRQGADFGPIYTFNSVRH